MTIDFHGTTALVTGASSGLGAEFARQLGRRGANLVLVARRVDRLEELAVELRAESGIEVTVIAADLAHPRPGNALFTDLAKSGIVVDTLVANAGFGTFGPFDQEDPDRVADEIALNVSGLVDVIHSFYPGMKERGRGALVTVASTAAYQPVPNMAVYGATKAFVLSFTEALWYEARHSGLRVLAVSPGATATEFFDVAGNGEQFGVRRVPASDVVSQSIRILDRRRGPGSFVSGAGNGIAAFAAARLAPRRIATAGAGRLAGA
jgi:short-subunit dehydrogenase